MKQRYSTSRRFVKASILEGSIEKAYKKPRSRVQRFRKSLLVAAIVLFGLILLLWRSSTVMREVYCSMHEQYLFGLFTPYKRFSRDQVATAAFGTKSSFHVNGATRPDPDAPITVLLYSKTFPESRIFRSIRTGEFAGLGKETFTIFGQKIHKELESCKSFCRFTTDQREAPSADVILFELNRFGNVKGGSWCLEPFPWPVKHQLDARLGEKNLLKPPHQLWGWLSFEQPSQFPILLDPYYLSRIDFHMNWKQGSDIPITYICTFDENDREGHRFLIPPDLRIKEKGMVAAYVASRCRAKERDKYIREMMKDIFIHSFGKCLHNSDFTSSGYYNWNEKVNLLKKFKFVFVFENSNEYRDWVTEKLVHAFLAQAVPVYWGASNIEDFLPGNRSAILARDFLTPRHLAQYLKLLDSNDEEYLSYFEWKKSPLRESFTHHLNRCVFQSECRICEFYEHHALQNKPNS